MALYNFEITETGDIIEVMVSISEYDDFVKSHPELKRVYLKAPAIVSSIGGWSRKTDDGFKDMLKNIKKSSGKGNTINV